MHEPPVTPDNLLVPESGVIDSFQVQDVIIGGNLTTYCQVTDARGQVLAMNIPTRDGLESPRHKLRDRFLREVEILQQLDGSEFPRMRASGFYSARGAFDIPYIVTDMPRGKLLDRVLSQHRAARTPDVEGGIRLLRRLARALKKMQACGIVHRHLKPQRICLDESGNVEILDFVLGIASSSLPLTDKVSLLGTATYVAPEQVSDPHHVDGRADLYSLGLIVYEYVTHHHPQSAAPGADLTTIVGRIMEEPAPASSINPEVPPALDAILQKLLRPNPDQRYPDAATLLRAVDKAFPEK